MVTFNETFCVIDGVLYQVGDNVNTTCGKGTIVGIENIPPEPTWYTPSFLVKIHDTALFSDTTKKLHERQGGLCMGHNELHRTRKACNFPELKFPEVERIARVSRRAYDRVTRRRFRLKGMFAILMVEEAYTLAKNIHQHGLQVLQKCNTKWEQEDNNVSL